MTAAGGNGYHVAQVGHLDRTASAGRRTVAKLAVGILAPRPYCPISLQRQAVALSRGNGDYTVQICYGDIRQPWSCRRPISQLIITIVSPGANRAVGLQRKGMVAPCSNRYDTRQVCHHNRGAFGRGGSISQLAVS